MIVRNVQLEQLVQQQQQHHLVHVQNVQPEHIAVKVQVVVQIVQKDITLLHQEVHNVQYVQLEHMQLVQEVHHVQNVQPEHREFPGVSVLRSAAV